MERATKKSKTEKPVLYSYWRSSCSWRVRIALALKGIEYEYKAIHLVKDGGEQLKEEYTSINPSKEVPTLLIDGHTITQSTAIIEYLDETRRDPSTSLMPDSPIQRAQVREVCQMIGADTQPVQNLRVLRKVMSLIPDEQEKNVQKVAWGAHFIELGFTALEKKLAETAGEYCVGDKLTMADLFIPPQVYNANRFKVDMDKFPKLKQIAAKLDAHPAVKAASPDKMPDAQ